jgi:hypothetical protein
MPYLTSDPGVATVATVRGRGGRLTSAKMSTGLPRTTFLAVFESFAAHWSQAIVANSTTRTIATQKLA